MEDKLLHIANFIDENRSLIDVHMVDFITDNLWEKNVPAALKNSTKLCQLDWLKLIQRIHQNQSIENEKIANELEIFIRKGKDNILENLNVLIDYSDDRQESLPNNNPELYSHLMNPKKRIEIQCASKIINNLCTKFNINSIIDIGSGKGYLSSHLALKYKLNVLGIDSQKVCSQNAETRNNKLKKLHRFEADVTGSFRSINHTVEENSPIIDLWGQSFPSVDHKNILLVGLHTCGDLAVKAIHLFLKNPDIKVFFNIGCCYHLLEEEFSVQNKDVHFYGFPLSKALRDRHFTLGRKARMLASESLHRIMENESSMNPILFYRSLLQVLIKDKFKMTPEDPVGRIGKKCKSFHEYVRKSLKKLNLNSEEISNEELDQYLCQNESYLQKMQCLHRLRSTLAPVIESIIMLDRFNYLNDHESIANVYLTQICSPIQSPRCYALVAIKKSVN